MITLDHQTEHQLEDIAKNQGLSVPELIQEFIQDYYTETAAIKRAEESYQDYIQTGETVSLEQLMSDNDLAH
jgi:hypothetical protein